MGTRAGVATPPDASASPADPSAPPPRPSTRRLWFDLTALAVVGVLLVGAVAAGTTVVYRELYSPTAFVLRYLDLLAEGRAADALTIAGVTVDSAELEAKGLPVTASEALLRRAALAPLTRVAVLGEEPTADGATVTVSYRSGNVDGTTTFDIQRAGSVGFVPTWRFARSPLAVIDLAVNGSMSFDVNGFAIDKRQVSPDGLDADPLAAVPLLVFSPGLYSVSVDTAIAATPGVAVLSDSPLTRTPITVQAEPTDEFRTVVQERVDEFLTACTTQQVLQPTGCPFGFYVRERIASEPIWSIAQQPQVVVQPDGAGWKFPAAEGTAHIEVDIRSLFDGSVRSVSEDVPFTVVGQITILPDGKASIVVSAPGE